MLVLQLSLWLRLCEGVMIRLRARRVCYAEYVPRRAAQVRVRVRCRNVIAAVLSIIPVNVETRVAIAVCVINVVTIP